jgi:hypothetical protein
LTREQAGVYNSPIIAEKGGMYIVECWKGYNKVMRVTLFNRNLSGRKEMSNE